MFGFGKSKEDLEAIALLRAKKFDEALAHFSARYKKDPEDSDAVIEIAKIHFRKLDFPLVKQWLLKLAGKELSESQIWEILELTNFKKLSSAHYFNSYPSFSADGQWVVFTSARQDTNGDGKINIDDRPGIYAVNVESGTEIEIVPNDFYNAQPVFSPDGKRIAFQSARQDSNNDGKIDHTDNMGIYVKHLRSEKEECLVEARYRPKFPSFSPDGESLLFCAWQSQTGACGVYMINLQTKIITTIHSLFECNFPVFSPKGDRIIFSNWRNDTNKDGHIDLRDNSALYEFNLKSQAENLLAPDEYSNSYPSFSPDGESFAYLSRRRDTNGDGVINSLDNSGIYLFNIAKRKEKMIVGDDRYNKFLSFSHDGRHVLFTGSWSDEKKKKDADHSEYFESKGIHIVDTNGDHEREIVSSKHYGCRFLAASPKANLVAYISWRKDTNRGLYLAPFDRLPSPAELKSYIENNL